jgi:hypothetical protein
LTAGQGHIIIKTVVVATAVQYSTGTVYIYRWCVRDNLINYSEARQ